MKPNRRTTALTEPRCKLSSRTERIQWRSHPRRPSESRPASRLRFNALLSGVLLHERDRHFSDSIRSQARDFWLSHRFFRRGGFEVSIVSLHSFATLPILGDAVRFLGIAQTRIINKRIGFFAVPSLKSPDDGILSVIAIPSTRTTTDQSKPYRFPRNLARKLSIPTERCATWQDQCEGRIGGSGCTAARI